MTFAFCFFLATNVCVVLLKFRETMYVVHRQRMCCANAKHEIDGNRNQRESTSLVCPLKKPKIVCVCV